jgi:hypothetical protein
LVRHLILGARFEETTIMERATKMTCPSCGAALVSRRGVRVGRTVKCPRCAFLSTVPGEDGEAATGVNPARLSIVLVGGLVYLIGGAGLAYYCFSNDDASRSAVATEHRVQPGIEDDGAPPAPPPPLPPGRISVSTAEQRRIDAAVAAGAWYLRSTQVGNGSWDTNLVVGYAALAGLALLECGIPPTDPCLQRAAQCVRQQVLYLGNTYDTYQRALAILFLDRFQEDKLGNLGDRELIQYLALCIMAAQHPTEGAWHYSCPVLDRAQVPDLLRLLDDKLVTLDRWRQDALKGASFDTQGWDNSNTQFAILALWAAQRHGVPIGKSIALAEKHFRSTQLPSGPDPTGNNLNLDGSWYYDGGQNSSRWPSMTCAGLLALAEGHATTDADKLGERKRPLDDPAIRRALAMLAQEIDRPGEVRPPDLYFLWSLERVGVLYDLPKIGDKDWYTWGYKTLLTHQLTDGSWRIGAFYGNNPILNTAFALLFLKQANLTQDLTNKLQLLQTR